MYKKRCMMISIVTFICMITALGGFLTEAAAEETGFLEQAQLERHPQKKPDIVVQAQHIVETEVEIGEMQKRGPLKPSAMITGVYPQLYRLPDGETDSLPIEVSDVAGTPKEIKLYSIIYKTKDTGPIEQKEEKLIFDSKGRLRERYFFYETGESRSKILYEYNEQDKLVEWSCYTKNNSLDWRYVYVYDDNNRLLQKIFYDAREIVTENVIYTYEKGLLVEKAVYGIDGIPQWRKVYEYPAFDVQMSTPSLDVSETREVEKNMWSDINETIIPLENENWIEWTVYAEDGRLLKQGKEQYNSRGLIAEEILLDETEDLFEKKNYTYNQNDSIDVIKIEDRQGNLRREQEFQYNEKGNITEVLEKDFQANRIRIERYEYTYDEKENWLTRRITEMVKVSESGEDVGLLERAISSIFDGVFYGTQNIDAAESRQSKESISCKKERREIIYY